MNKSEKIIALAGIMQAAKLVDELATHGKINQKAFNTSIYSIFQTDSKTCASTYGGIDKLEYGLRSLAEDFYTKPNQNISRYLFSLIVLERQLNKRRDMLKMIGDGIRRCEHQIQHFSLTHDNVIAGLASTYIDTISTFNLKIRVLGNENYLGNKNTVNKIRAILLSGVRSAVLYRQVGGTKLGLLFGRKKIHKEALDMLNLIKENFVDSIS